MLISFSLGNYRSFNGPVMLSMKRNTRLTGEDRLDETHLIRTPDMDLLKSAAIYGANASGKSNLLRGLMEMRNFVFNSQREFVPGRTLTVDPFAFSEETPKEPSIFEVYFLLEGDLFRYGFELDRKRVVSEWLYQNGEILFDRPETDQIDVNVKRFKEGKGLEQRTGESALFLSVCVSFDGPIAGKIVYSFFGKIVWINSASRITTPNPIPFLSQDETIRKRVVELAQKAGTGIKDIIPATRKRTVVQRDPDTNKIEDEKVEEIKTLKIVYQCPSQAFLYISDESAGTRKLIHLAGPLFRAMERGQIIVIDELDTQLHPLLMEMLLELFHSRENRQAQMIFTTHNTYPLRKKMLRRDQIWFTEKQQDLSSRLVNLAEYRIRPDASYEKDYLNGRYGGVPLLEIPEIFGDCEEETNPAGEES